MQFRSTAARRWAPRAAARDRSGGAQHGPTPAARQNRKRAASSGERGPCQGCCRPWGGSVVRAGQRVYGGVWSAITLEERRHLALDAVADGAKSIVVEMFRIGKIPVHAMARGEIRARIATPHGHDVVPFDRG